MHDNNEQTLGEIIRLRRVTIPLTLQELGTMSGVSTSHLGRIEKGGRFPSARVLRKIAEPLGFNENELFALAGYLSPQPVDITEPHVRYSGTLDPYVSRVLSQEPVETQRAIIGIINILKNMARSITK